MRILNVVHRTLYRYEDAVSSCCNLAVLMPRPLPHQRPISQELLVEPVPVEMVEEPDLFGNRLTWFRVDTPHNEFLVESRLSVELEPPAPAETIHSWRQSSRAARDTHDGEALARQPFLFSSPMVQWGALLQSWVREYTSFEGGSFDLACEMMQRIKSEFRFDKTATHVGTTVEEVLEGKRGVCQDFSHLMVAALRHLGIPARYVSGYLETNPPPGKPKPIGADVSHAWVSVWDMDAGWRDFDPTNNLVVGDRHVTLAYGRDFGDISPLKGILEDGGRQTMVVSVDVREAGAVPQGA